MPSTYTEFQALEASSKIGLAIVEAAVRLSAWSVYSASKYRVAFSQQVVSSLAADGEELTAVSSIAALTAGTYYHDRAAGYVYAWLADSSVPDASVMACTFRLYFSNQPVILPHDLDTGYDVEWLPLMDESSSGFVTEVENSSNLLGVAVSTDSSISLANDQEFWSPIFDKYTFETRLVLVYSWHRGLAASEARLLYRGRITGKSYTVDAVTFELADLLDELRSPVVLATMDEFVGATIPDSLGTAKQRRLYGFVKGHEPTGIDQVLPTGYVITGTVTASYGSATLVGSGTSFLAQLSPGDELYIGSAPKKVRVDSVSNNTSATLSAVFDQDGQSAAVTRLVPSHPKRYANRRWLVAGHALARPSTLITQVIDSTQFFVEDTTHLYVGEQVECNGSIANLRIVGDGFVKLESALSATPAIGDSLYLSSVSHVFIDDVELELTTDYTYDATTAVLTLDPFAERNIATTQQLSGASPTITVTNGGYTVTGSGTQFRRDLKPGDWIRGAGKPNWLEVLEVVDDTSLILRTAAVSADAGAGIAGEFRAPKVVDSKIKVTCDALGKADESGNVLRYAGGIAQDLLADCGLSDFLVSESFSSADELLPHRLGLAIPARARDTKAPKVRDVLNQICRSTFTTIVQNSDFLLAMVVLDPSYIGDATAIAESDMVADPVVSSDSGAIVRDVNVTYGRKQYDPASASSLEKQVTASNDRFLSSTEKAFDLDTVLVDEDDAHIVASRWAFLLDVASSEIEVDMKLGGMSLDVNSIVEVSHPKLCLRFGSSLTNRIGAVISVKKGITGVSVRVHDLANSFTRCARIAADGSADHAEASEPDKRKNGYITDSYGLTNGSGGINLLW